MKAHIAEQDHYVRGSARIPSLSCGKQLNAYFPHGGLSFQCMVKYLCRRSGSKRWRGKSPSDRPLDVPAACKSHTSGRPICNGMYPFSRCTTLGEKRKVCNVVNWAASLHNASFPRSILVADSYYSDLHLVQISIQRYLCSIKSDRFKNLQDSLAEHVKQPGQWNGKYNAAAREIIVRH